MKKTVLAAAITILGALAAQAQSSPDSWEEAPFKLPRYPVAGNEIVGTDNDTLYFIASNYTGRNLFRRSVSAAATVKFEALTDALPVAANDASDMVLFPGDPAGRSLIIASSEAGDAVFMRYDLDQGSATLLPTPPYRDGLGYGCHYYVHNELVAAGPKIYVTMQIGLSDYPYFFSYDPATSEWSKLATPPANTSTNGSNRLAMAYHSGDHSIYAVPGNESTELWRYDIATDHWHSSGDAGSILKPVPVPVYTDTAMIAGPAGTLYLFPGFRTGYGDDQRTLHRYDIAKREWTALPPTPGDFNWGPSLTWLPGRNRIFATPGWTMNSLSFWQYTLPALPPPAPTALAQQRIDGSSVAPGSELIVDPETGETSIVLKARVIDPFEVDLQLEVDLRRAGDSFSADPVDPLLSDIVSSGSVASVRVDAVTKGSWHWRARAVSTGSGPGPWILFDAAGATPADVVVAGNILPFRPAAILRGSDGIPLSSGAELVDRPVVRIEAFVGDPDGDDVEFEVEFVRNADGFSGVPTHSSGLLAGGETAAFSVPLASGDYSFRYRYRDSNDGTTPWLSFGSDDATPDIVVAFSGSRGGACLGSAAGSAAPFLLALALLALRRRGGAP